MKRLVAIGVIVLLLLAFVFAVTEVIAPLPPEDDSVSSSSGLSVAGYLKIFNATLVGGSSSAGALPSSGANVAIISPPQTPANIS